MATKRGTKPPASVAKKTTPPGSSKTATAAAAGKKRPKKAAKKIAKRGKKKKAYRDQIRERTLTATSKPKKTQQKKIAKSGPKPRELTDKQQAFAVWYVAASVNMNATEAARRAGYKGNDNTLATVGAENLRKPAIRAEIDKRLARAMSGAEVTVEAVLRRLSVIGEKALEAEQFAPAAKCAELHGKYLKMFTDRIEHVQDVEDMSTAELVRLLMEVCEAGGIDLLELIKGYGSDHGGLPDPAGSSATH